MRLEEARESPGERRLADALRPPEDEGLRELAAAIGVEQRALGRLIAEKIQVFARMRRAGKSVAFRRARGFAAHLAGRLKARGRWKCSETSRRYVLRDFRHGPRRVDDAAAGGLLLRDVEKGAPQPLMISEIAVLETIPAGASDGQPARAPRQPAGRG